MEISEEGKEGAGLAELPENCIATILSFTTVKDVCRFASVSTSWRSAAGANLVWEKMITQRYGQNISQAISSLAFPSKKQLYIYLFKERHKRVGLDELTGKIGCMIYARDLEVIWGDSPQYLKWIRLNNTRFEEIVRFRLVWWFDMGLVLDYRILSPNTHYTVSFIVRIDDRSGRYPSPFIFSLTTPDGVYMESARFLDDLERPVEAGLSMAPISQDENGWTEVVAGEFFLGEVHATEGANVIRCNMKNVDGYVKAGILVVGAKIMPKI